ncbi:FAD-binding oxidoreductase [Falsiroseomonas sp. HC035]|uniref:FAD-binding oxidoreductase n=1 Tax=Falsiroseomonas sp. HC035 TaxID=3390999 RepID=UPI003D31BABA
MGATDRLDALAALVGPAQVLTTPEATAPYSCDWSARDHGTPLAVLRPGTTAEVAACVGRLAAWGLPMVPSGGRTGLVGGMTPADGAVVISLERLNRIRDVDARDMSLVAESGATVQAVQQAAEAVGRLFPLSFGAEGSAQLGGALSTNAGGIRTIRWGNARDLVLGLEVVLPDGRVLHDLRRVRKDNSGYALRHLFIGAEGTLGLITAAALKLAPPLRVRETALAAVESPTAALAILEGLQADGAELVAFELINREIMQNVAKHGARVRMPFQLEAPWYVLVELGTGARQADLRTPLESALAECQDAVLAESEEQRQAMWRLREITPECNRAEAPMENYDVSVPVSAVPALLDRVATLIAARWPEGRLIAVGHAGDGNMHISVMAPRGTTREAWRARMRGGDVAVHALAVELGGSFSAEHGIGRAKLDAMATLKDPVALDLMQSVKHLLDPRGLMNPGKLLPAATQASA